MWYAIRWPAVESHTHRYKYNFLNTIQLYIGDSEQDYHQHLECVVKNGKHNACNHMYRCMWNRLIMWHYFLFVREILVGSCVKGNRCNRNNVKGAWTNNLVTQIVNMYLVYLYYKSCESNWLTIIATLHSHITRIVNRALGTNLGSVSKFDFCACLIRYISLASVIVFGSMYVS